MSYPEGKALISCMPNKGELHLDCHLIVYVPSHNLSLVGAERPGQP